MIWAGWEAIHRMPERIACEVGKMLGGESGGAGVTPEQAMAARMGAIRRPGQ